MNLQKGDLMVVHRPRSPMVKSTQSEEEEAKSFAQLKKLPYIVGDLSDL